MKSKLCIFLGFGLLLITMPPLVKAQAMYERIPAFEFHPLTPLAGTPVSYLEWMDALPDLTSNRAFIYATINPVQFVAPVHIPNGKKITKLVVRGVDNGANRIEIRLFCRNGWTDQLREICEIDTTGALDLWQNFVGTVNWRVDYSGYDYFIVINMPPSAGPFAVNPIVPANAYWVGSVELYYYN